MRAQPPDIAWPADGLFCGRGRFVFGSDLGVALIIEEQVKLGCFKPGDTDIEIEFVCDLQKVAQAGGELFSVPSGVQRDFIVRDGEGRFLGFGKPSLTTASSARPGSGARPSRI